MRVVALFGAALAPAFAALAADDLDKRLAKLATQLRDSKPPKHEKAFAELQRLGGPAVPVLAEALPTASASLKPRLESHLRGVDARVLAEVARNSRDPQVRRALPGLISDQAALTELARNAPPDAAEAAVAALDDPGRLAVVAREAADPRVRGLADSRLMMMATNDPRPERRLQAVAEVEDPARLTALLRAGSDPVRLAVIAKLDDPAALAVAARDSAASDDVRLAALAKVRDPAVLEVVAKGPGSLVVRRAALALLTDPARLADLARRADDSRLRAWAVQRLDDQKVLLEAARQDPDAQVRLNAVAMLTSRAALQQVAARDASSDVKQAAASLARRTPRGRPLPQLVRDLAGADAGLARYAAEVLKAAGPAAAPALTGALSEPDPAVVTAAARELERLGEKAVPGVMAALADPKAATPALTLLPRLSPKPVVGIAYPSGNAYGKAVGTRIEAAAAGRALLIACPDQSSCAALPRHVLVSERVSEGSGCYDKYSFGSNCSARSQDVRLEVAFVRDGSSLSTQSISATTPSQFKYKTWGAVSLGPSKEDIRAATSEALAVELAKLDPLLVERLLAP
jgi:hypothetical protein